LTRGSVVDLDSNQPDGAMRAIPVGIPARTATDLEDMASSATEPVE